MQRTKSERRAMWSLLSAGVFVKPSRVRWRPGRVLAAVTTACVCGDSGRAVGGSEEGLDGFGGILFADENFQEPEFGLDPLVLPVLLQHRHPVLLLDISTAEEKTFVFLFPRPEEVS